MGSDLGSYIPASTRNALYPSEDAYMHIVHCQRTFRSMTVIGHFTITRSRRRSFSSSDNKLLSLFESVNQTFSFAKKLQELREKVQTLENVITQILKQTTECGFFVQDYVARGFYSTFECFSDLKLKTDALRRESSWTSLHEPGRENPGVRRCVSETSERLRHWHAPTSRVCRLKNSGQY